MRGKPLVGRLATGSPIALSPHDHAHRAIFIYGEYEPEVTALLRRILAPGKVFFDLGANAGFFTLLARDLGAAVHAFEPNPEMRALLEQSLSLDSRGSVILNSEAMSRESGLTVRLYISEPGNSGMSSLERKTDRIVEVETLSLDDYVARTGAVPDVIKVDVEGHQKPVFEGGSHLLATGNPCLVVEARLKEHVAGLMGYGYKPSRILADGSTMALDFSDLPKAENLFFARD
jgi:FkbM family methyltransferase